MPARPHHEHGDRSLPLWSQRWRCSAQGGPTCLLIHGLGDGAHVWSRTGPALSALLPTLAIDLRGHGHSPWDPDGHYSVSTHVTDVSRVLEQSDPPSLLVGHSLGGEIALRLAAQRPGKTLGLVLVDYNPSPNSAVVDRLRQAVLAQSNLRFASHEAYLQHLRTTRPLAPVDFLEELSRSALRACDDGSAWMVKYDPRLADFDAAEDIACGHEPWQMLTELPVPVLILRGSGSSLLPRAVCERMAANAGDGRMTTVPRAGHGVACDNPDGLNAALCAFASEMLTARGRSV